MPYVPPYDVSADALFSPAKALSPKDFFQDWQASDLADTHLLCAELSRLVYAGRDVIEKALPRAGLTFQSLIGGEETLTRIESRGTDGFVATREDGWVFLVFRGTESNKIEDMIADIKAAAMPWHVGGKVHQGFCDAYMAVQDRLRRLLAAHPGRLVVCGHSLGAACATLAASDFAAREPELVTFGSPRVGDFDFLATLHLVKIARYVDCCDIVPRVPPKRFDQAHLEDLLEPFLGSGMKLCLAQSMLAKLAKVLLDSPTFSHAGAPIYIDRHGSILGTEMSADFKQVDQHMARNDYPVPAEPLRWQRFFKPLVHALRGLRASFSGVLSGFTSLTRNRTTVPFRDLADHAPINYVRALAARR